MPKGNAFSLLMSNSKRKKHGNPLSPNKKTAGSNFASCPLGCGQHVAICNMDWHVDACPNNGKFKTPGISLTDNEQSTTLNRYATSRSTIDVTRSTQSRSETTPEHENEKVSSSIGTGDFQDNKLPHHATSEMRELATEKACTNDNAFSRMMERSHYLYSQTMPSNPAPIRQTFHLHDTIGRLSWLSVAGEAEAVPYTIKWSGSVKIRNLKSNDEDIDLELTLSSSIPSLAPDNETSPEISKPRLVRRQSRLSVSEK